MSIPFTQYKMPHGMPVQVSIDRPDLIERKARQLGEYGCVFEIEMLTTGQISMTVEAGDKVLAHEICDNGPDVPLCVDKMVRAAHDVLEQEVAP